MLDQDVFSMSKSRRHRKRNKKASSQFK